jgi:CubicO group peptidase (beta-lactamase class C family)
MTRQDQPIRHPGSTPRTARQLGIMRGHPPPPEKRPTLENWDLPPFNRWSFQNVRALIPSVDVHRGTGPVDRLQSDPQPLGDLAFTAGNGTPCRLSEHLLRTYTDGFLVCHEGRIVYEKYFNDMVAETLHLAQSVSKSVIGLLTGVLHGQGLVDLDTPLADMVPELADCGYSDANLGQVLDMRSGVRFTEDYNAPDSDMTRVDIAAGWRPAPDSAPRPTIRDVIVTLPRIRGHGGDFEYRSIETDVIAWVLERVTGTDLAQLVSRHLWQPIGAERDACFTVDGSGTALADGGFNATLRDFSRLGMLMLNGGRAMGRQVVPEAWIDGSRHGDADRFGTPYTATSPHGAYRRFWWIHDNRRGDVCARGVFGQMIYADPTSELLVVKLSSWPDYLIPSYLGDTFRAIDAIRDALNG